MLADGGYRPHAGLEVLERYGRQQRLKTADRAVDAAPTPPGGKLGVCEKLPQTLGTMFNTQVYIGPRGTLLGKHQKIMPTVGERLVHMGGFGDTFGAFQTEFGPMSGLICGENSNPLAIFALTAESTRIHVMSWPNHFPTSGDPLRNRVTIDAQAFAQMSKAFVISACGTVDEDMIGKLEAGQEAGGDARGRQSAAVIVANRTQLPYLDLRDDDHPDPVAELRRLYRVAAEDGGGAFLRFQLKISSVVGSYGGPEGA